MVDNPELAEKMGENGKLAVFKSFNWEAESQKLLELYSTLLATKTQ
jgi:glycosyltransferase involved in cell wall biosynthesis